jgi:hypothetical protein
MQIGTVNGVAIIAFPGDFPGAGLTSVDLQINDAVAENVSPFTGQSQVFAWPGADMLTGTITWPPMLRADAQKVVAFLMECRGKLNGFLLCADPQGSAPSGQGGSGVIAGSQNAMATSITTRQWEPNTNVLMAGDYIQIGVVPTDGSPFTNPVRLHCVLSDVTTDASGDATIPVWPSLREPLDDGVAVVTGNPVGLFRLADNQRTISVADMKYGISLKVKELR